MKKRVLTSVSLFIIFIICTLAIFTYRQDIFAEDKTSEVLISANSIIEENFDSISTYSTNNNYILYIAFLNQGEAEKNCTFYVDGTPYMGKEGVLAIYINSEDTSLHTVYAVSIANKKSTSCTFCFSDMDKTHCITLVPADASEVTSPTLGPETDNISFETGILKSMDPLDNGKLFFEDGRYFDYDNNLCDEEHLAM